MERFNGLREEWLRLGGADAAKAERDLQMAGPRSKKDSPLKDLEDGAFTMARINLGFDAGAPSTQAMAGRITLEGYNVLRAASFRASNPEPVLGRIYLMQPDASKSVTLASGEFSLWDRLEWTGELWLQGTWYVDAMVYIGYAYDNGCSLDVLSQKMQRGMEP